MLMTATWARARRTPSMMEAWLSFIGDDPGASAQGGQNSEVRHVAGRRQQRRLGAAPVGERRLELLVHRAAADDEPSRTGPRTPAVDGRPGGGDHIGVIRETEVVVGHEAGHGPTVG